MEPYVYESIVTHPPTSAEVEHFAINLLFRDSEKGTLDLTVKSTQEIPAAKDETVRVQVTQILKSQDGGKIIRGVVVDDTIGGGDQSATITTGKHPSDPARLMLIGLR